MNPRQRRGALLIGLAVVGAIAVFLSVSSYVADIQRQVGPMVTVVRLTTDVPGNMPIPEEAVELVEVPERWAPVLAVRSLNELEMMVLRDALPAGTVIEQGDITEPSVIGPDQRQIAIMVDAETGVAGEIQVGDYVDIISTHAGGNGGRNRSTIAIQNAQILSVGTPQLSEETDVMTGAFAGNQVVPITFVLPTDDALKLAYVEGFGQTVRLALRAPNDDNILPSQSLEYAPDSTGFGG